MKKQTWSRLLLLAAVALVGLSLWSLIFCWDNKYTAALPGGPGYNVLQDPSRLGFLVDGWELYPGQLLAPGQGEETPAGEVVYAGQYSNFSHHLDSPYGVATYRLVLENPGEPVELALFLPELLCAGKVYIGGELAGEQGQVEPYQPMVVDGIYLFTAEGDTEILIQCANYTHYYSGMYYPPAVGLPGTVFRMQVHRMIAYGALSFGSLAVALFSLAQWLLAREKMTWWMGMLCLAFSAWMSYPFFRALGAPLVRPLYALEDVCSNLVLFWAFHLAGELSGRVNRWYHRRLLVPMAAGICAAAGIFPVLILPYAPDYINLYSLALFLWELGAGVYLLFLAGRFRPAEQPLDRYLFAAAAFYGLAVVGSALSANYFEPIRGAWLREYGGFAMVVGFGALMVHREVLLIRENRRLTFHLQEEVDRKTQALEALLAQRRELLANLIHDLKNPLAAVRNYCELVGEDRPALDPETAGYLEALQERVAVVGERFGLLQDFSRGERGLAARERLSLNQLLGRFHQSNQPDLELSGQEFLLRLPQEELWVLGDENRLWTALENLCYNALGFTGEGDTITLRLEREGETAAVRVEDTGAGIPPEDLPRLFQRGFTSRPHQSGEGLGLAIVHATALEHGGDVQAEPRPGGGSVFTIRLPLAPGEQETGKKEE